MKSQTAIFRTCCAWLRMCWMKIASMCTPFVFGAWAELTCFMVLGWRFPEHVFDLHTAYLSATNILLPYDPNEIRKRQHKRLPDACRSYGVGGWENIDKGTIAKDI